MPPVDRARSKPPIAQANRPWVWGRAIRRSTWKKRRNWIWRWWISSPPRLSITEPFARRNRPWSSTMRSMTSSSGNLRTWVRKFPDDEVIDLIVDDHGLFRRANGSVIESLGGDDIHHRHIQLRRFFQVDRRIARPHTQGRFA